MYKDDFKTKGIIRIVLNKGCEIQYASIDNQDASKYLKKLFVLDRLTENLPVKYDLEDYFVSIDMVNIAGQGYYVIAVVLKYPKCENCKKALTDSVTGLYNRNYWEQISSGAFFHPGTQNFSLILIDIDNLKEINDTYGHFVGDKAIEIVGQAIRRSTRKEDLGVRYGGDEFIIVLFNQDKKATEKVIKRIREEINKIAREQGLEGLDIQISTGMACNDCLSDMVEMLKMADKELYDEKETKKKQHKELDALKNIRREIEKIRNELDRKIYQGDNNLVTSEILELSNKLDELILKYLNESNKEK